MASKVIDIYVRDKIFDHAATVGDYSAGGSRSRGPSIGGRGSRRRMIGALELVADKASKKPLMA